MNAFRMLGLALLLSPGAAFAAETGSGASLGYGGYGAAAASARGDFTLTQGRTAPGLSHGLGIATDRGGVSLSGSTAVGSLGHVRGGAVNITVGPGRGAASSAYGGAYGCYPSIAVGGSSRPAAARGVAYGTGRYLSTGVRAVASPRRPYYHH